MSMLRAVSPSTAAAGAVKATGGKRGGRRNLTPEARERIAAAQRARWAASRGGAATKPAVRAKPAAGRRGGRRELSPEARERIAAAQRARWAASRGGAVARPASRAKPASKRGGRRELVRKHANASPPRSAPAGPHRLVARPAARAKPASKRGGRRQLSPEARERIAAAQRARWAAARKGK